jgi:hypothetical protein
MKDFQAPQEYRASITVQYRYRYQGTVLKNE